MRVTLAVLLVCVAVSNFVPVAANGLTELSSSVMGQVQPLIDTSLIESVSNLGVAAALVLVIILQQREKSEMRNQNNEWEKQRHADSEKLAETLREMTRHCAETVNTMRTKGS